MIKCDGCGKNIKVTYKDMPYEEPKPIYDKAKMVHLEVVSSYGTSSTGVLLCDKCRKNKSIIAKKELEFIFQLISESCRESNRMLMEYMEHAHKTNAEISSLLKVVGEVNVR